LKDLYISCRSRIGVRRASRKKTGIQASANAKATGIRRMIRRPKTPNRSAATSPGLMVPSFR
jgi:hypothetical protein